MIKRNGIVKSYHIIKNNPFFRYLFPKNFRCSAKTKRAYEKYCASEVSTFMLA